MVRLDVIINLLGHPTSQTGLKVYAMEDRNVYPSKHKITDAEMAGWNLIKDNVLPKWNYMSKPR